jgi:hypothetical protein
MHQQIETEVWGLTVKGTLITGDWYGDANEPGCIKNLDPYVEDMYIESPDGTDLTGWLTDDAIIEIEEKIIEKWGNRDE